VSPVATEYSDQHRRTATAQGVRSVPKPSLVSSGTVSSNLSPGYLGPSKNAVISAIFDGGKKGFCPGFCPRGKDGGKRWCDVFQVNRRDPRKSFHAHCRATASCPMAHPRRRKLSKLSARPRREGTFTPGMTSNGSRRWRRGSISSPIRLKGHFCLERWRSAAC
jgi:hypothetical protein